MLIDDSSPAEKGPPENEEKRPVLDLYELLYLPCSRKGHIKSVLADGLGISLRTLKRRMERLEEKYNLSASPCWDRPYWREHGFLCEADWNYVQKSAQEFEAKDSTLIRVNIPENIRKIHPNFLSFVCRVLGFKQGALQNIDRLPLLDKAADFMVETILHISEVHFALVHNNLEAYEANVQKLRFPFPFPKDSVWEKFMADGEAGKAWNDFDKEFILLGILCFDMAVVTFILIEGNPSILTGGDPRGTSALIGAFKNLSEGMIISHRKSFFDDLKKVVREQSNQHKGLYSFLANGNESQKYTIKKQCARVRRQWPTPKDLNDFLERVFKNLGVNEADINRHIAYYRNLFAHYLLVELVKQEYVSADTACGVLFDKLCDYRKWLCQEIFNGPFPS
jgi:hypothetical protein